MAVKKSRKVFNMYYGKLTVRLALFLCAIVLYVASPKGGMINAGGGFFLAVWALFMLEMILKLFPLKLESMGSQKQFKQNFAPVTEYVHTKIQIHKRLIVVIILWIALNAVIAHLYFKNLIDTGIMVLISLFYSVCDMICILFYCPFQHILGNKCCTTCRIYNWDYIMMFTPLAFVDNAFAVSLFIAGVVIFVRWEYTAFRHPERFAEKTNANLSCVNCKETRCTRKGGCKNSPDRKKA